MNYCTSICVLHYFNIPCCKFARLFLFEHMRSTTLTLAGSQCKLAHPLLTHHKGFAVA